MRDATVKQHILKWGKKNKKKLITSGAKMLANRRKRRKQVGTKSHLGFQHTKDISRNTENFGFEAV